MNLINEQHIAWLQVCEHRHEVALPFNRRAAGDTQAHAHFGGNDLRQGGLAEARWAIQQHVIKWLPTIQGCPDKNAQVVLHACLADVFVERSRTKIPLRGEVVILANMRREYALLVVGLRRYGGKSALRPGRISHDLSIPQHTNICSLTRLAMARPLE